jgi:hypothetical protein
VEFTLNGARYTLDASAVRTALRGRTPDDVRDHWVDVDGVRWPPKQVLALATSLGRSEFTSHMALRQLQRLGFATSVWGGSGQAPRTTPATTRRPRTASTDASPASPIGDPTGRIILVGCSGSKAASARPAAELFTGAAFRKARDLARRARSPWYVLSAKFGLLHPDEVIAPYDVYLPDRSSRYRHAWGSWVVAQLSERHELRGLIVEVHAGRGYCEPIEMPLTDAGATVHQPLAGLRQGERLAWYGTTPEPPPVSPPAIDHLFDERNAVPPMEFLTRGRTAANAPGLYSWWVDEAGAHDLSAGLGDRVPPGLVYAGRAGGVRPNGSASTNTLWGRVGQMHLGGNRQFSTFRMTLAACLSSEKGPVMDEAALTIWMQQHLRVAVLPIAPNAVTAGEEELLRRTDPPLNLSDVPPTPLRATLRRLRSALVQR